MVFVFLFFEFILFIYFTVQQLSMYMCSSKQDEMIKYKIDESWRSFTKAKIHFVYLNVFLALKMHTGESTNSMQNATLIEHTYPNPISANFIDHQIMPLCDFKFVCRFSSLDIFLFFRSGLRSCCMLRYTQCEHIVLFFSILKAHFIFFLSFFLFQHTSSPK